MKTSILLLMIICLSCFKEITCEERAERLINRECAIIANETPSSGMLFNLNGISAISSAPSHYKDQGEVWYVYFHDKISIGDTVIKHKGELKFYIHKKDTVLVFPFECKGEIYE